MNKTISLIVNGKSKSATVDTERLLLDVIREDLQLTGAKYGCGEGHCGACTVLVDGKNIRSCQVKAADYDSKPITTIEGLAHGDTLHPVQEAFLAERAMQCGFCVPGMILATVALLKKYPQPTREQINSFMNVNLCRCNNYTNIMRAIHHAAGGAGVPPLGGSGAGAPRPASGYPGGSNGKTPAKARTPTLTPAKAGTPAQGGKS